MTGKKSKSIALIAIAALSIASLIIVIALPLGTQVNVIVEVEDQNVSIQECALKKLHPLSTMLPPGEDISQGDRTIVLKLFYNQTELSEQRHTRSNIGTGTCILKSNPLPDNLPNAVELLIRVELYDANGFLITSAEDSLVYK